MTTRLFDLERLGDTLIVSPVADLRELEWQGIENASRDLLATLNEHGIRNLVLDFSRTDYFGSTALALFVRLWKKIRDRGGRMAFCNLSAHERDILGAVELDRLWPLCDTREEAIQMVTSLPPSPPARE